MVDKVEIGVLVTHKVTGNIMVVLGGISDGDHRIKCRYFNYVTGKYEIEDFLIKEFSGMD